MKMVWDDDFYDDDFDDDGYDDDDEDYDDDDEDRDKGMTMKEAEDQVGTRNAT